MVMIDRSAEGRHCGELGQGVALFSLIVLILSLWLFSILTDGDRTTVKFLFISYLPFFLSHWLTFVSVLFVFFETAIILRSLGLFFCFT